MIIFKKYFYIFFNGFVSGLCVIFGVKKYFSAYFLRVFLFILISSNFKGKKYVLI